MVDMANMFADYFMEKIEKIRSSLDGHPKYEPSNDNITPLLDLTPATEDGSYQYHQCNENQNL